MPGPVALTPSFLRAFKPPASGQVEYADGACPGLRLRVSKGGSATWVLGCRDAAGKPRRFVLGAFPALGLAKARDLARERREEVRQGRDPVREAREVRQKAAAPMQAVASLTGILDGYARDVGSRRRSWPEARKRIENVFAKHLTSASSAITAPELMLTVDAHASRSSAGAAVRYIRPVLKWGAKRGLVARGIAEQLDQPEGALAKRDRQLTADEMGAIMRALDGAAGYGRAMRWLFWTGCRLGEACDMRWRDIDWTSHRWTVPQTKQGRPHVVPLPAAALAFVKDLVPTDDDGNKLTPDPDTRVFTSAAGGALANWDRATKQVQKASGTTGWHRHDIRRSVATLMGDLGVQPHIIEVCLGHELRSSSDGAKLGRVATIYNRSRYEQEHAEALELLAGELARIEQGGGNVLRFRA